MEKEIKKQEKIIKCECPEVGAVPPDSEHLYSDEEKTGMNHEAEKCQGTNNIKLYQRGKHQFLLCSCCYLSSDTVVE
ncbi:MAG: hypothetical protein AABY22_18900 [Nanoarchaeota archaeon]